MSRGSDSVLSVYSDARTEYTKQLSVYLIPAYFQFYVDLLETSRREMASEPKRVLWQFQTYLNEIHDWNMERVRHEIQTIQNHCGCDYLEDLLTAVFIAHTKVLTAIRLSTNQKKVEIHIPKIDHFLFKVLCETSKLLWSSTYLFRDNISGIEKQQNYRQIEQLLHEGMLQAVRSLVPVKSILKDFVNQGQEDEEDDKDEKDDDKEEVKDEVKEVPKEEPKEVPKTEPVIPAVVPEVVPAVVPAMIESHEPVALEENHSSVPESMASNHVEPQKTSLSDAFEEKDIPTIVVHDKPNVRFGPFHAMFDSQDGNQSDLVYDEGYVPDQELEESSDMLLKDTDLDVLDLSAEPEDIDDYEELA